MFTTCFSPLSRGFVVCSLIFGAAQALTAITADAHPHKRHGHRHGGVNIDNIPAGNGAKEVEVQITVHQLTALDRADAFSKEDFFAIATINGQAFKSERIKQTDAVHPNWKFSAVVPNGKTNVKLAVYDKDLAKDDPIDINRVDNKRDLDFVVDTRRCTVEGFREAYKCGNDIRRAGAERKKAELVFMVTVNNKP